VGSTGVPQNVRSNYLILTLLISCSKQYNRVSCGEFYIIICCSSNCYGSLEELLAVGHTHMLCIKISFLYNLILILLLCSKY